MDEDLDQIIDFLNEKKVENNNSNSHDDESNNLEAVKVVDPSTTIAKTAAPQGGNSSTFQA